MGQVSYEIPDYTCRPDRLSISVAIQPTILEELDRLRQDLGREWPELTGRRAYMVEAALIMFLQFFRNLMLESNTDHTK
jgi:hypothetical protein